MTRNLEYHDPSNTDRTDIAIIVIISPSSKRSAPVAEEAARKRTAPQWPVAELPARGFP